jgi:hypothetical protein
VYVLRDHLTVAELTDVEERKRSPIARRRFGVLLRGARRTEDAPLKAALKAAVDQVRLANKGGNEFNVDRGRAPSAAIAEKAE